LNSSVSSRQSHTITMLNQDSFRTLLRAPSRFFFALAVTFAAFSGHAQASGSDLSVTTLAGVAGQRQSTNGSGTAARFFGPSGLAVDSSGNLVLADAYNNLIRTVSSAGVAATIAGNPLSSPNNPVNTGSTDGTGIFAQFNMGFALTSGDPYGAPISTNIGAVSIGLDSSGNAYIADTLNNTVRKVTPAGVVTTIAGTAGSLGSTDATGTAARFNSPAGLTIDTAGNIYVADTGNNLIRKITPAGVVTTLAGTVHFTGSDDGVGTQATFGAPYGIVVDPAGNLYVADNNYHNIRKIAPNGTVTTLAGRAGSKGSSDGIGTQARFNSPSGIAIDKSGNLYVADTGNNLIRMITPAGAVTTIAGTAGASGSADGAGATARFNNPNGIAVDSSGTVYISDTDNQTIRKGTIVASTVTIQIVTQPKRQLANVGNSVSFSVTASSTPTTAMSYQWLKNGTPIAGANASTYTITSVQSSDSASYSVNVSGGSASVTSSSATLTVYPSNVTIPPAVIFTQPSDVTVGLGGSATLTVDAYINATAKYQWQKSGTAITGANAASYTIASAQASDAGTYTVAITDGSFWVTSNPATVTVTGVPATTPPVIATQPIAQSVTAGANVTFTVVATGNPAPTYQWQKNSSSLSNGGTVSGATTASLTLTGVAASDAGSYSVIATNSAGAVTSNTAALTVSASATAPVVAAQPTAQTATAGGNAVFTVVATGTPAPSYQWQKNGTLLSNGGTVSGATTSTLTLTGVTAADAANYTVVVTNSAGAATSSSVALTVNPAAPTAWLSNLSVRTTMTSGQTLIVGLTVSGGSSNILVRGAGPALSAYLANAMADPRLELYNGTTLILSNDNWDASLANTFASVGAFAFASGSKDAAFVPSLSGGYTVHASGTGPGAVLVEAYDTRNTGSPRLTNVSARNRVGTGDDILIAGFNIAGSGTKKLLIRAVGPKLVDYGVTGSLNNPKLELYNSAGVKLTENDDWDSSLAATFDSVGAFALSAGSRDAALVTTLAAGAGYTVQVKGADGGTGEGLIEIYELP
jgi:sugar lactone lactonase YvrE